MKTFLFFALILLLSSSCKTAIETEDPDNFTYVNGSVHLTNGETLWGRLTLTRAPGAYVKVYIEGEKKPQYHRLPEVAECTIQGRFYELKKISGGIAFSENARLHFMFRLTPPGSRIALYELASTRPAFSNRYSGSVSRVSYFLQLPGEGNGVWDINHSRLAPHFAAKMSKIVADCPVLAQKIASRQEGYFYPLLGVTDEERLRVVRRIIDEYNRCH
jgi:hypothetical protein